MTNLHRNFSRFPGTNITSATLTVEFSSEWNGSLFIKSSKYTTVLKDIKGKEWNGTIESSPQLISDKNLALVQLNGIRESSFEKTVNEAKKAL